MVEKYSEVLVPQFLWPLWRLWGQSVFWKSGIWHDFFLFPVWKKDRRSNRHSHNRLGHCWKTCYENDESEWKKKWISNGWELWKSLAANWKSKLILHTIFNESCTIRSFQIMNFHFSRKKISLDCKTFMEFPTFTYLDQILIHWIR